MKAKISLLILMALLAGSTVWVRFPMASADYSNLVEIVPMEHCYIRNDGTIEPPTLPIERAGNFYLLKGNIMNYTIEIQKSNIIFDGNGFTLSLPPSVGFYGPGIWAQPLVQIKDTHNIIIQNTQFKNYLHGVSIVNSSGITILANNFTKGSTGVSVISSSNCDILGNNLADNSVCGLGSIESTFLEVAYNNISRNQNNGCSLYSVTYSNITRNNIQDNSWGSGPSQGIYATMVSNNRFFENNFVNNPTAIAILGDHGSYNNSIYRNYFHDNSIDILNTGGDAVSGRNESPLQSPLSIEFEPELYLQSSQSATSSNPSSGNVGNPEIIVIATATLAITFSVLVFCLWYYRRRHAKNQPF